MTNLPTLYSFEPCFSADARILILGSMPGARSLADAQYYAHPHNIFWPIMGSLFGAGPGIAYPERLDRLKQSRIALWDVLYSCARPGSLDQAIRDERPNDFGRFFLNCPAIEAVLFNGQKAAASFKRSVLPQLGAFALPMVTLPSTSPAHAGMRFEDKMATWRAAFERFGIACCPMPTDS